MYQVSLLLYIKHYLWLCCVCVARAQRSPCYVVLPRSLCYVVLLGFFATLCFQSSLCYVVCVAQVPLLRCIAQVSLLLCVAQVSLIRCVAQVSLRCLSVFATLCCLSLFATMCWAFAFDHLLYLCIRAVLAQLYLSDRLNEGLVFLVNFVFEVSSNKGCLNLPISSSSNFGTAHLAVRHFQPT